MRSGIRQRFRVNAGDPEIPSNSATSRKPNSEVLASVTRSERFKHFSDYPMSVVERDTIEKD